MHIQTEKCGFDTNSVSRGAIALCATFLMCTAPLHDAGKTTLLPTERIRTTITQNTGGINIFQKEQNDYYRLCSAANRLLADMTDIPVEFDQLFQEKFLDLLA